jgi:hypothetical protein
MYILPELDNTVMHRINGLLEGQNIKRPARLNRSGPEPLSGALQDYSIST